MVQDATTKQREAGQIPRIHDVTKYIREVVERVERKNAAAPKVWDTAPSPAVPRTTRTADELNVELKRRIAAGPTCRTPGTGPGIVVQGEEEPALGVSHTTKMLVARIRLLKSKPEWAARMMTINPLATSGALGPEKRQHAEALYQRIIEDSDRIFGPWWKPPPERLFFT